MLIEQGWTPGVWIDGHPSRGTATTDAFGTFAHCVHEDLIASRTAGHIPAHVEITISASSITPLWGDNPPVWLLHIRLTGLGNPEDDAVRDEVTAEAFASLDRRGAEHFCSLSTNTTGHTTPSGCTSSATRTCPRCRTPSRQQDRPMPTDPRPPADARSRTRGE